MKALVVIPTYNEKDNILSLLQKILSRDPRLEALVVDDASPDGTGNLVEEFSRANPRVSLLRRPGKLGLGSAYRDGFRRALDAGADLVLQMDADHSHDPAYLPDFLATAEKYDLVLGSRYLTGINVVNWPLTRLILSYSANRYARLVTGVPVRDLTGGYKCFRRSVLEAIDFSRVRSDGYGFQIETTFQAWRRGFRIREIPIVFVDRHSGTSKLSRRIIWEALWLVWRLRFGKEPTGDGR
jgi:dolichol-phosphate mannosyltransferase